MPCRDDPRALCPRFCYVVYYIHLFSFYSVFSFQRRGNAKPDIETFFSNCVRDGYLRLLQILQGINLFSLFDTHMLLGPTCKNLKVRVRNHKSWVQNTPCEYSVVWTRNWRFGFRTSRSPSLWFWTSNITIVTKDPVGAENGNPTEVMLTEGTAFWLVIPCWGSQFAWKGQSALPCGIKDF